MDDNSHGTHVAGIAAAETDNNVGIAGIAWGAKIMALKVLQSSGYGTASNVAAAVNYARLNGATVINMSLGTYAESQTLKIALENAYATATLVAAAGNDTQPIEPVGLAAGAPMFPACYPWMLGVMASIPSNGLAAFSNFDHAGPLTEMVLLGNLAIRAGVGKKVLWDGPNMKSTNLPKLNPFVQREYRKGWSV